MRVIFFGSGEFAVPSLRKLANMDHEVAAVVTQPDRPAGRGKKTVPTPISLRAEVEGLPVEKCANVNEPAFVAKLRDLRADLGVVAAFGQKMLEPVRTVFPGECVNLHASLLPKYRGAAPIHWAILAGEKRTGVTVFRLVDRIDAGPILVQRETLIGPGETTGELHDRLAGIACDALAATLELFERDPLPPGGPQDETLVTRAPKLDKSDGYLRFDEPAERIALRCRAMSPWPGARCQYVGQSGKSEVVTFHEVAVVPKPSSDPPGTITDVLTVAATAGTLEIHSLQPAGKRVMSWQDFVNGRQVRPQDRFETLGD